MLNILVSEKAVLLLATLAFTPELRNLSIGSNKGWNGITSKLWKILDALLVQVSLICLLHSSDFGHVTHIFLISKISLNKFMKRSQPNFYPFYHISPTHTPWDPTGHINHMVYPITYAACKWDTEQCRFFEISNSNRINFQFSNEKSLCVFNQI